VQLRCNLTFTPLVVTKYKEPAHRCPCTRTRACARQEGKDALSMRKRCLRKAREALLIEEIEFRRHMPGLPNSAELCCPGL